MEPICKDNVGQLVVPEEHIYRRIDRLLMSFFKTVPQSRIYHLIRSGQVRVNGRRVLPSYRTALGDVLRLPPIHDIGAGSDELRKHIVPPLREKDLVVIHEDEFIMVVNKPADIAVHAGSSVSFGFIEQLRVSRPDLPFVELAHRLDRDTSGLLLLAKRRQTLITLHEMFRQNRIRKRYAALCLGAWPEKLREVRLSLTKQVLDQADNKKVVVDQDGQYARTLFRVKSRLSDQYTLLEVEPRTGRTHQIRVHMAASGYPIVGDERYGSFSSNKELMKKGLKRMFLHARELEFKHPRTKEVITLEAELPSDLTKFLNSVSV